MIYHLTVIKMTIIFFKKQEITNIGEKLNNLCTVGVLQNTVWWFLKKIKNRIII